MKRRWSIAVLGGVVLAAGAVPALALEPLFAPGIGPIAIDGPLGDDAACESCHAEAARDHRSSAHARSAIDPVFLAAYRGRPDRECVRCHAPRAPEGASLDHPLASRGVSCSVCHVRDGAVSSARAPAGPAPHPVVVDPRMASVEACASCHQFEFSHLPTSPFAPGEAQQDTVSEWLRARGRASCQSCHMPRGEAGPRHSFPGLGDPSLLARAVRARVRAVRRLDGVELRVTLRAGDVGHAVPTGDPFRRLRVRARWGEQEAHEDLRRFFAPTLTGDRFLLAERDDTRVPPPGRGSREVRLRVSAPADRSLPIVWSISILRLDPDVARRRGLVPETIAPGTIAPGTIAPETIAPGTIAPGTIAPGTIAPGTIAPETIAPETIESPLLRGEIELR